jgi:hypothetical protein
MQAMIVVKNCPFKWKPLRDYTLEASMSDDGKFLEVFTIEGDKIEEDNEITSYYSALKKYAINIALL